MQGYRLFVLRLDRFPIDYLGDFISLALLFLSRGNLTLSGLNIHDAPTVTRSGNKLRLLSLQLSKLLLSIPDPRRVSGKEKIHLLKSSLVTLGVEGPDHRDSQQVAGTKDVQSVLANVGEHDRAEEGEPAVADTPTKDSPGVTLGSDLKGEDLGRVQPRDSQPSSAEHRGEDEDERGSSSSVRVRLSRVSVSRCVLAKLGEGSSKEHGNTLTDSAPV